MASRNMKQEESSIQTPPFGIDKLCFYYARYGTMKQVKTLHFWAVYKLSTSNEKTVCI